MASWYFVSGLEGRRGFTRTPVAGGRDLRLLAGAVSPTLSLYKLLTLDSLALEVDQLNFFSFVQ